MGTIAASSKVVWERLDTIDDVDYHIRRGPAVGGFSAEKYNGNMFTHTSYVRAHRIGDLVYTEGNGLAPALYSDKKSYLLHVGRLNMLSTTEIYCHCTKLFENTEASFIVFEDVRLQDDGARPSFPSQFFRYQENWRRKIGFGEKYMSSKRASNLRRILKKLRQFVDGAELELRFHRCRPGDVDAIAVLNKTKLERAGRHHYLTNEKQAAMERLCSDIGYTAGLYCDGDLLAGTIICVAGSRGYIVLLGHDMRYEKFSPGLQATSFALSELERMGCTEANFLWGDSRWKSDFLADRETLTTVIVRRNNRVLLSKAHRKVLVPYAKHAAKALIKPYVKDLVGKFRRARRSLS